MRGRRRGIERGGTRRRALVGDVHAGEIRIRRRRHGGSIYDARPGERRRRCSAWKRKIAAHEASNARQRERALMFPDCSSSWSEKEGGFVWCDADSDGAPRFPRNGRPRTRRRRRRRDDLLESVRVLSRRRRIQRAHLVSGMRDDERTVSNIPSGRVSAWRRVYAADSPPTSSSNRTARRRRARPRSRARSLHANERACRARRRGRLARASVVVERREREWERWFEAARILYRFARVRGRGRAFRGALERG